MSSGLLAAPPLYDNVRLQQRRDVRRVPGTFRVGLIATAVALVAGWLSVRGGLATAYWDAIGHATIARRVWDAANPGFGQLGTVWLPVPHLLLAPLTLLALANENLWRDGWSGVLLSSVCMGVGAAALFRVLYRWGVSRPVVVLVPLSVYVLNPSNLYLHTTAMTEPVLLAAMAMAAAGLSSFLVSHRPLTGGEMAVYAGLPTAAAVGSRYDGWVFAAAAGAFVFYVAQVRWRHWRYSLRVCASFLVPSVAVAVWWIVLNATQYGDVLAFQRGPYSAQTLQREFAALGLLPTDGSLGVSANTYSWVIWYVLGPVVIALCVLGLAIIAVQNPLASPTGLIWVLMLPLPYHLFALVSGQSVIWHPHTHPPGLFNVRYALPLILPAALAIGYALQFAVDRTASWYRTVLAIGTATLVIGSYCWQVRDPATRAPVISEATGQAPRFADLDASLDHLNGRAAPGDTLLIDETANPALVKLGWPFDRVIARFDGRFDQQLRNPTADWILIDERMSNDAVWEAITNNRTAAQEYSISFSQGSVVVLRRMQP